MPTQVITVNKELSIYLHVYLCNFNALNDRKEMYMYIDIAHSNLFIFYTCVYNP